MRTAQRRPSTSLRTYSSTHMLAVLFLTLQSDSVHMDNFGSLLLRNDKRFKKIHERISCEIRTFIPLTTILECICIKTQ